MLFNEVGNDLGVGFGHESVAFSDEGFLERKIVLDDAVVNDHDLAAAITVRMGVLFGGPAMSSPTSVADPVAAFTGILAKRFLQIAELS